MKNSLISEYDDEIVVIKEKYALNFEDTELYNYVQREAIVKKAIQNIYNKFLAGKKILFRGAGCGTDKIIDILGDSLGIIVGVVDIDNCKRCKNGIKTYSIEEIRNVDFDYIVIASFKYRKEMTEELISLGYRNKIFDIYDYLAEEEIYCDAGFWEKADPRLFYLKITKILNGYNIESDDKKRELCLRRLISCYLSIRDFSYAIEFLKKYEMEFGDKLNGCLAQIEDLLSRIKLELSKKTQNHIIMLWLDQLRYCDMDRMPYLKKFADDNVCFEKCYTQNLQTSTTFKMMFAGQDVLDDKAYLIDVITRDNSVVYKELVKNQYDFKYIGWGKNNVYFDGISSYSLEKDNCILPLNIWKVIIDILQNNKNTFYLSHSFEAHEHHWCGYMTRDLYNIWEASFDEFETRYYECIDYINRQLDFYVDWFNDNNTLIIMSDHGQELENVFLFDEDCNKEHKKFVYGRWSENSLHTVMCIKNRDFGKRRVGGLFSLVQFIEIVTSIIEKKWLISEKTYVKIQSMPFYSKEGLRKIKEADDFKFAMLAKGVITSHFKYLRYADGLEELYVDGNEKNNRIADNEYADYLKKFKELVGPIDYSIFTAPKYKEAKDYLEKIYSIPSNKIDDKEA